MSEAFVYLWRNAKTKKFYLGSHKGTIDDGYTHSSRFLPDFPHSSKVVPDHYTRRILAYGTASEMYRLEYKLHANRKAKCWDRYYNVKVSNYGKEPPTINFLHECFDVNVDTGTLTWKARPLHHFKTARYQKRHHTIYAGKKAGNISSQGYPVVGTSQNGKLANWRQHRIIWAMHYGYWPTKTIDHIDGDKANNAITNLREVTVQENARNRRLIKNSVSGHTGVNWHKRAGKWEARIGVGGYNMYLGSFTNKEDAIAARQAAEIKYW